MRGKRDGRRYIFLPKPIGNPQAIERPPTDAATRFAPQSRLPSAAPSVIRVILLAMACCVAPVAGAKDVTTPAPPVRFESDQARELNHAISERAAFGLAVGLNGDARWRPVETRRGRYGTVLFEPELVWTLGYTTTSWLSALAELKLAHRSVVLDRLHEEQNDTALQVTEAYLLARAQRSGLSLQLGRQLFEDGRDWWYDESLDAVRVQYREGAVGVQASYARDASIAEFLHADDVGGGRSRYLIFAGKAALANEFELAAISLHVLNRRADAPHWQAGLRASGTFNDELHYRADVLLARSDVAQRRQWGHAADLALDYAPSLPLAPMFTVGIALGSEHFRPTGLQEHNAEIGELGAFYYYGEVLQPNLSNLVVTTAALSLSPYQGTRLGVVHHLYRQRRLSRAQDGIDYDLTPSGNDTTLGQAVDLIATWSPHQRLQLDLALGAYFPGSAFAERARSAWSGRLELEYRF